MQKKRYRKGIAVLLTVQMLFIVSISTAAGTTAFKYGDLDKNGDVNILDVLFLQKSIASLSVLSAEQKVIGDVDGDGVCNINDVLYMQRYIASMIMRFPVEEQQAPTGETPTVIQENPTDNEGWYEHVYRP